MTVRLSQMTVSLSHMSVSLSHMSVSLSHMSVSLSQITVSLSRVSVRRSQMTVYLSLKWVSVSHKWVSVSHTRWVWVSHTWAYVSHTWLNSFTNHYKSVTREGILCISSRDTGWRRYIGCIKWQVSFRKRANHYMSLLWKMTYNDDRVPFFHNSLQVSHKRRHSMYLPEWPI